MSDSSQVGLYYFPETVWGDGGGVTPTLNQLRFTNESLKGDSEFVTSQEIRSDRQVADVIRTSIGASGDVGIELSYGAFDDLLEGLFASSWVTDGGGVGIDRLDNGTTLKSFLLEKQQSDITEFQHFLGMRVGAGSLTIEPGSIVTGSLSFQGQKAVAQGTTRGDGSPAAAPTNAVVNAIDNITAITEGGGAFGGDVLQLTLNVNNNPRGKPAVGVLGATDIGFGQFEVTGTLQAYFQDRTLLDKYLNDTASSMSFEITDAAGNKYIFTVPKLKWSDGDNATPGNNQDVVANMSFTGYRDSVTGVTLRLDRDPA